MKDYLGPHAKSKDLTPERYANSQRLLSAVNSLMMLAVSENVLFLTNPRTKSQVSGETFGGFRPQSCPQGSPTSAHKEGLAVDIYDPTGAIDKWLISSPAARRKFEELEMYFESTVHTAGWSHWSIRRPASGKRFFNP